MKKARIILCGACGKMGGNVLSLLADDPNAEAVCGVDLFPKEIGIPVYPNFSAIQEEADVIAGLYDDDYLVRLSKGMIVNSRVIVLSGPFQGREGLIKKIDRHRRIGLVEMTMMGRPMEIQIPLEIVEKVAQ